MSAVYGEPGYASGGSGGYGGYGSGPGGYGSGPGGSGPGRVDPGLGVTAATGRVSPATRAAGTGAAGSCWPGPRPGWPRC